MYVAFNNESEDDKPVSLYPISLKKYKVWFYPFCSRRRNGLRQRSLRAGSLSSTRFSHKCFSRDFKPLQALNIAVVTGNRFFCSFPL